VLKQRGVCTLDMRHVCKIKKAESEYWKSFCNGDSNLRFFMWSFDTLSLSLSFFKTDKNTSVHVHTCTHTHTHTHTEGWHFFLVISLWFFKFWSLFPWKGQYFYVDGFVLTSQWVHCINLLLAPPQRPSIRACPCRRWIRKRIWHRFISMAHVQLRFLDLHAPESHYTED
jgi:hypothetical protein